MSVQVELLNKFLITLCPATTQTAINNVFQNFYKEPLPVMYEGINNIQLFIHDKNGMTSGAAINGIILGIFMARISETPENQEIFKGWLEQYSKVKGEHVIDFQQEKAKRRH